ncbi:hypothetical protein GUY59_39655 [Nonomuraea sp. K271]|nr:hypothetical protein [Nonomuraea sp. K271]
MPDRQVLINVTAGRTLAAVVVFFGPAARDIAYGGSPGRFTETTRRRAPGRR